MDIQPAKLDIRRSDPELVKHIEGLLEQAKKGELTGIAYVGIWHGNNVSSSWCQMKFDWLRTVVGEIHFLTHRLIAADND